MFLPLLILYIKSVENLGVEYTKVNPISTRSYVRWE